MALRAALQRCGADGDSDGAVKFIGEALSLVAGLRSTKKNQREAPQASGEANKQANAMLAALGVPALVGSTQSSEAATTHVAHDEGGGSPAAALALAAAALEAALAADSGKEGLKRALALAALVVNWLDDVAASGAAPALKSDTPAPFAASAVSHAAGGQGGKGPLAAAQATWEATLQLVALMPGLAKAELRGECIGVVSGGGDVVIPLALAVAKWLERGGDAARRRGLACRALAVAPVLRAHASAPPDALQFAVEQCTLLVYHAQGEDELAADGEPKVAAAADDPIERARQAAAGPACVLEAIAPRGELATLLATAAGTLLQYSTRNASMLASATAGVLALAALAECAQVLPNAAEALEQLARTDGLSGALAADGCACECLLARLVGTPALETGALRAILARLLSRWARGVGSQERDSPFLAALLVRVVTTHGAEGARLGLSALQTAAEEAIGPVKEEDSAAAATFPGRPTADALLVMFHAAPLEHRRETLARLAAILAGVQKAGAGASSQAIARRAASATALIQLAGHMRMHTDAPPAWLIELAPGLGFASAVTGRVWALELPCCQTTAYGASSGLPALADAVDAIFSGCGGMGDGLVAPCLSICMRAALVFEPHCLIETAPAMLSPAAQAAAVAVAHDTLVEADTCAARIQAAGRVIDLLVGAGADAGSASRGAVLAASRSLAVLMTALVQQGENVRATRALMSSHAASASVLAQAVARAIEGSLGDWEQATGDPAGSRDDAIGTVDAVASALSFGVEILQLALADSLRDVGDADALASVACSAAIEGNVVEILSEAGAPQEACDLLATQPPAWLGDAHHAARLTHTRQGLCGGAALEYQRPLISVCAAAVASMCSLARSVASWVCSLSSDSFGGDGVYALRVALTHAAGCACAGWARDDARAALALLSVDVEAALAFAAAEDLMQRHISSAATKGALSATQRLARTALAAQMCDAVDKVMRTCDQEQVVALACASGLRLLVEVAGEWQESGMTAVAALRTLGALSLRYPKLRMALLRTLADADEQRDGSFWLQALLLPPKVHGVKLTEEGIVAISSAMAPVLPLASSVRREALAVIVCCYDFDSLAALMSCTRSKSVSEGIASSLLAYYAYAVFHGEEPTESVAAAARCALMASNVADSPVGAVRTIAAVLCAAASRGDRSAMQRALIGGAEEVMRAIGRCGAFDAVRAQARDARAGDTLRRPVLVSEPSSPTAASAAARSAAETMFSPLGASNARIVALSAAPRDSDGLQTACTYDASGNRFVDQHWYFCYTCGLTNAKGMCSVCARVCHAGHDIVYSRKSRFFCDCGAGGASVPRCMCRRQTTDLRQFPRRRPLPGSTEPSCGDGNELAVSPSSAAQLVDADPWLGAPALSTGVVQQARQAAAAAWQGDRRVHSNRGTRASTDVISLVDAIGVRDAVLAELMPAVTAAAAALLPEGHGAALPPATLLRATAPAVRATQWREATSLVSSQCLRKLPPAKRTAVGQAGALRARRARASSTQAAPCSAPLDCCSAAGIFVAAEHEAACVWRVPALGAIARPGDASLASADVCVPLGFAATRFAVCAQPGFEGFVAAAGARGACAVFAVDACAGKLLSRADVRAGVLLAEDCDASHGERDRAVSTSSVDAMPIGDAIVSLQWAERRAPWLMVAVASGVEILDTSSPGAPAVAAVAAPRGDMLVAAATAHATDGCLAVVVLTSSGKVLASRLDRVEHRWKTQRRTAVGAFDLPLFESSAGAGAALHWSSALHAAIVAWDASTPIILPASPDLRAPAGAPRLLPEACARLARAPTLAARREGRSECGFVEAGDAAAGLIVMSAAHTSEIAIMDVCSGAYASARPRDADDAGGAPSAVAILTAPSVPVTVLLRSPDGAVSFFGIKDASPPWRVLTLAAQMSRAGDGAPAAPVATISPAEVRPSFAYDFFEHCKCSTAEVELTGTHARSSEPGPEPDATRLSLSSEGAFLEGAPEGFSVVAEYSGRGERLIAGVRFQVGGHGAVHSPLEVRVGDAVTVRIKPSTRRWYDVPLSAAESTRLGRRVTVAIGATASERSTPKLDSLEVYTQTRSEVNERAKTEAEAHAARPTFAAGDPLDTVMALEPVPSLPTAAVAAASFPTGEVPGGGAAGVALEALGHILTSLKPVCVPQETLDVVEAALCFDSADHRALVASATHAARALEGSTSAAGDSCESFGALRARRALERAGAAAQSIPPPGAMSTWVAHRMVAHIAIVAAGADAGHLRFDAGSRTALRRVCKWFVQMAPRGELSPTLSSRMSAQLACIGEQAAREAADTSCLDAVLAFVTLEGMGVSCWAIRRAAAAALATSLVGKSTLPANGSEAASTPWSAQSALTAQLMQLRGDRAGGSTEVGGEASDGTSTAATAQAPAPTEFQCDQCGVIPIQRTRWHCRICADYDLCELCYAHQDRRAADRGGGAVLEEPDFDHDAEEGEHVNAHPMVAMSISVRLQSQRRRSASDGDRAQGARANEFGSDVLRGAGVASRPPRPPVLDDADVAAVAFTIGHLADAARTLLLGGAELSRIESALALSRAAAAGLVSAAQAGSSAAAEALSRHVDVLVSALGGTKTVLDEGEQEIPAAFVHTLAHLASVLCTRESWQASPPQPQGTSGELSSVQALLPSLLGILRRVTDASAAARLHALRSRCREGDVPVPPPEASRLSLPPLAQAVHGECDVPSQLASDSATEAIARLALAVAFAASPSAMPASEWRAALACAGPLAPAARSSLQYLLGALAGPTGAIEADKERMRVHLRGMEEALSGPGASAGGLTYFAEAVLHESLSNLKDAVQKAPPAWAALVTDVPGHVVAMLKFVASAAHVTGDSTAAIALWLLVASLPEHTSVSQAHPAMVAASELVDFVRGAMLERAVADCHREACHLLRLSWYLGGIEYQSAVVGALPLVVQLLPVYGNRGAELLRWLSEALTADGAAASHFDGAGAAVEALLASLSNAGAVIREHPHSNTYAALGRLLDMPGYHLDATPCDICSAPAPLPDRPSPPARVIGRLAGDTGEAATGSAAVQPPSSFPAQHVRMQALVLDSGWSHSVHFTSRGLFGALSEPHTVCAVSVAVRDVIQPSRRLTASQVASVAADPASYGHRRIHSASVYACCRPGATLTDLKSDPGAWLRVASLRVPVDSQVSETHVLRLPAPASAVMVEIDAFHPGMKPTGAMVCPRCSQLVTDSYGVCDYCRENAYQCRQCRNINYEDLDAFMCNECGYSKYGRLEATLHTARGVCKPCAPVGDEDSSRAALVALESLTADAKRRAERLRGEQQQLMALHEGGEASLSGSSTSTVRGEATRSTRSGAALEEDLVALPSSALPILPSVSSAAMLYCGRLKETSHALTRAMAHTRAARITLGAQWERDGDSEAHSKEGWRQMAAMRLPPRGAAWCYGCARAHAEGCFGLLASLARSTQAGAWAALLTAHSTDAAMLLSTLVPVVPAAARDDARSWLSRIASASPEASRSICGAMRNRVCAALSNHAAVDLGAAVGEELRLLEAMAEMDGDLAVREWEARLRLAVELLLAGLAAGASHPAVARHVLRPCVRILRTAASLAPQPDAPATQGAAGALVDANAWMGSDEREGVRALSRRKALLKQRASASGSPAELRAARLALRWRARVLGNRRAGADLGSGQTSYGDAGGWLTPLLLSTCAPLRDEVAKMLATIAATSMHARLLTLSRLAEMLRAGAMAGAGRGRSGQNLFAMILNLIASDDSAALFLSARGTAVKVAALLAEQTAAMTAAERGVGSEAGGHMATALELSRLLGRLLALGPARSRVARSPPTLRCLVAVLADLKSLVTTASAESRECASSLQEHLAAIAADEPASRAAVVRECARVVNVATVEAKNCAASESSASLRRVTAALELTTQIVSPPKVEPDVFLVLAKSPTQEEFIRGGMGRAPHSTREHGLVLMRDVKNFICRTLELHGLLDDDLSMELLVAGRIIKLDLPVALVNEQVWKRHAAEQQAGGGVGVVAGGGARGILAALLNAEARLTAGGGADGGSGGRPSPMFVTYRLQGLDGDATEPMVDALDADDGAGEDPEVEFACTAAVADADGLRALVDLLRTAASDAHARAGGRALRAACLALLRCCAQLRSNRLALLREGALPRLIAAAVDMMRFVGVGDDDDSVQETLVMLGAIVEEAAKAEDRDALSSVTGGASGPASGCGSALDAAAQTALFLAQLRDACAQGRPRVAEAVARLLPFLTMGEAPAMDVIAAHFGKTLDGLDADLSADAARAENEAKAAAEAAAAAAAEDPTLNPDTTAEVDSTNPNDGDWAPGSAELNSLGTLALAVPVGPRGATQRAALVRAGVPALAARALLAAFGGCGERWRKDSAAWRRAVRAGDALQLVRVLTGSCRMPVAGAGVHIDEPGAALLRIDSSLGGGGSDVLELLHALEGASGTRDLGGAAEGLLDTLAAGAAESPASEAPPEGSVSAAVHALRQATREANRRRAEERRAATLAEMGFERMSGPSPGSHGSTGFLSASPGAAASSVPASAAIAIPGQLSGTPAGTPPSAGIGVMATVIASPQTAHSFEGFAMDELEEEEGALVCMVCREGYGLRPMDAMCVYCNSRRVRLDDNQSSGGRDSSGAAVAVRAAPWSGEAAGAATRGGAGSRGGVATVIVSSLGGPASSGAFVSTSHFNAIHASCHIDARRADSALRTPKREWEGAALRNSGTACNNLLPVRAPTIRAADYDRAAAAWFERLKVRHGAELQIEV